MDCYELTDEWNNENPEWDNNQVLSREGVENQPCSSRSNIQDDSLVDRDTVKEMSIVCIT